MTERVPLGKGYGALEVMRAHSALGTGIQRSEEKCLAAREHTVLLSRERVNKGTKRVNNLPLSPVVISYAILQGKPLLTGPA